MSSKKHCVPLITRTIPHPDFAIRDCEWFKVSPKEVWDSSSSASRSDTGSQKRDNKLHIYDMDNMDVHLILQQMQFASLSYMNSFELRQKWKTSLKDFTTKLRKKIIISRWKSNQMTNCSTNSLMEKLFIFICRFYSYCSFTIIVPWHKGYRNTIYNSAVR